MLLCFFQSSGAVKSDTVGLDGGITRATSFYTPMIEVVDYLEDNDFKVYICSGSDRFICCTFIEGMIDIPYERIIGMDVGLEATGQHGEDGLEYVFKAGTFNWLSDLAEDRIAEPAVPEIDSSTQYVLYLVTNNKDTNKPVFTQAEAQEKAKEILVRHFGGYTMREANGGWLDGDTLYQEYTPVIYLSDTNEDAVHAAADELVETFRQSSVLIQANPTRSEFYSGK